MNMRKRLIAGIIVAASSSFLGLTAIHADAATTSSATASSAKAVGLTASPDFRGRHCHRHHGWGGHRFHRHCGGWGDEDGDGGDEGGDEG